MVANDIAKRGDYSVECKCCSWASPRSYFALSTVREKLMTNARAITLSLSGGLTPVLLLYCFGWAENNEQAYMARTWQKRWVTCVYWFGIERPERVQWQNKNLSAARGSVALIEKCLVMNVRASWSESKLFFWTRLTPARAKLLFE